MTDAEIDALALNLAHQVAAILRESGLIARPVGRPRIQHEPRLCAAPGCQKTFTPRRRDQKFCGSACKMSDLRRRRQANYSKRLLIDAGQVAVVTLAQVADGTEDPEIAALADKYMREFSAPSAD